jgi:hypothetical protein
LGLKNPIYIHTHIYLRVGVEMGFLAVVQKGELAALALGPTRVAVRLAEMEHERKMDLAAAEANTGCWPIRMLATPSAIYNLGVSK